MEQKIVEARNLCLFQGILSKFKTMLVSEREILWGYGSLYLPDTENPGIGSYISVNAWGDKASVMEDNIGQAVRILSVYSSSPYRGKMYPSFCIDSFLVVK